jgi:diguanylate cyclase (GGDEF)-like protein
MIKPPLPHDETMRLQVLHSLRVLDTAAEERFDRITRLACKIFNVPIALVSMIDGGRQWFKSRVGLDATETPRDISFCGHAIVGRDVFVIREAREDLRFCDNPLVTGEPKIQFYAGYPLTSPAGMRIGTLCLIDTRVRDFSATEEETLRELGAMVEAELFSATLATTDELTRISNRRGFQAIGDHVLALCRRLGTPARLVVFDLDGFKATNDTLGHSAGDQLLATFARSLLKTFRDSDVVARLGGDEFGVLLTNVDRTGLDRSLARLDDSIRQSVEDGRLAAAVRYSAGSTLYDPQRHADIAGLLEAADQQMYHQKRERKKAG